MSQGSFPNQDSFEQLPPLDIVGDIDTAHASNEDDTNDAPATTNSERMNNPSATPMRVPFARTRITTPGAASHLGNASPNERFLLRFPAWLQASTGRDPAAAGFRFSDEVEGRAEGYNPDYAVPPDVLESIQARVSSQPLRTTAEPFVRLPEAADQMRVAYTEAMRVVNAPPIREVATASAGATTRGSTRGRPRRSRGRVSTGVVRETVRDNPNATPIVQASLAANPRGRASQVGRTSARGRGSRRRGASNAASRRNGPTAGWKIDNEGIHSVLNENLYLDSYISQRVRLFVKSALQRLKLELDVKNLTESRADVMVLFIDEVVQACLKWLNEFVRLKGIEGMELSLSDMYRYLAVLLYIHCSGFSMKKVIPMLESEGRWSINKLVVSFIHNNLLAFSPTGRGRDISFVWNAQRDPTVNLGEFERKAFRMSSRVYLSPNHTFCTLDDDLMGTRSQDNPLTTISSRKADKVGHSLSAVADAFFRVFLHARFARRGETRQAAVCKLISDMLESRGEKCLEGIVLTYDRGYASEGMVTAFLGEGVACICIMKDNTKLSHPFVGRSYFSQDRNDQSFSDCDEGTEVATSTTDRFDREAEFVIDDGPNTGMGVFRAVKVLGRGQKSQKIPAMAVRHCGSVKYSKLIRFMYGVPSPIYESMQHWVAVSHTWNLEDHLFNNKTTEGRIKIRTEQTVNGSLKEDLEYMVQSMTKVMTVAQRSADWFTLRKFRVTSTSAVSLLLKCEEYREFMNLPASNVPAPEPTEVLETLSRGWFSSNRSTDEMLRGTVNEDAVLAAFKRERYIENVFKVGMLCHKTLPWLGCSLDGIAVFDSNICSPNESDGSGESDAYIALVEIKTAVSKHTVARGIEYASSDLVVCDINSAEFQALVPKEHTAQLVHHCAAFNTKWFFYICASESQILYIVLSSCSSELIGITRSFYATTVTPALSWAHGDTIQPQLKTGDDEADHAISSQLSFWRLINTEATTHGPFVPVKIFKHASQTVYNKTKGGVDGNAQQRAILRCSTDTLKWEQKVVTQVFKSLAVNAWVAWRQLQKEELLLTKESFKGLGQYRHSLNKIESFADFIFELTPELLTYAEKLDKECETASSQRARRKGTKVKKQEVKRLISKAKERQRYRLSFFNSPDGAKLRLEVQGHDHRSSDVRYCALCGSNNKSQFRGHRSGIVCKICNVHLCMKMRLGFRRSCWDVWHTVKLLRNRQPKALIHSKSDGLDDENDSAEESLNSIQTRAKRKANGSRQMHNGSPESQNS